jgi:hypothetical protein
MKSILIMRISTISLLATLAMPFRLAAQESQQQHIQSMALRREAERSTCARREAKSGRFGPDTWSACVKASASLRWHPLARTDLRMETDPPSMDCVALSTSNMASTSAYRFVTCMLTLAVESGVPSAVTQNRPMKSRVSCSLLASERSTWRIYIALSSQ